MTTVPLVINARIPLNQGDYLPLEFMAWLFVGFVVGFFPHRTLLQLQSLNCLAYQLLVRSIGFLLTRHSLIKSSFGGLLYMEAF